MKLQLKKATVVHTPNWHPNFRNAEALPDLKVIRTSFFVNAVSATAAAAALLFCAYREYLAFDLRTQIAQAEQRIEAGRKENAALLAMNKEFADGAAKFAEAEKFMTAPFQASELLRALSFSLPENMDFTGIVYEKNELVLRGTIRGASETASTRLSAYLDVLRADQAIAPVFPDVSLRNLLRDPRTQGLSFEILLKPAAKKEKKGKS